MPSNKTGKNPPIRPNMSVDKILRNWKQRSDRSQSGGYSRSKHVDTFQKYARTHSDLRRAAEKWKKQYGGK